MEDKNIEKLMNENWAKMSDMLESEMPVKENKRRIGYFMWLAAASFLGSIYIFGYSEFNHVSQNIQLHANLKEHANKVLPNKEEMDSTHFNERNIACSNLSVIYNKSQPNLNIINKNKGYLSVNSHSQVGTLNESIRLVDHIDTDILSLGNIPKVVEKLEETGKPNIERTLSHPISAIPIIQSSLITNREVKNLSLIRPMHAMHRKWHFGLALSGVTHDYSKVMSISAGVFSEYRLSSRWLLSTGIRWSRFNVSSPFYSRNNVFVSNISKEFMDLTTSNSVVGLNVSEAELQPLSQEILRNITEHLDYGEFNIGGIFKLSEKLNITTDVICGLNIKSTYTQSSAANDLLKNYNEVELTQVKINALGELHDKYIWRIRSGFDWKISTQFFATTKADIFLNNIDNGVFDHGQNNNPNVSPNMITNLGKDKLPVDRKIGVEIGLKYYFK